MTTATTLTVQVSCIRKRGSHYNPHERIEGIGGYYEGKRWYLSEDEAIRGIDNRTYQFFVSVNGHSVWVVIAAHNGRRYLRTTSDGYAPNNLLNLPECP
ncbi:DUF3892 domain-containing protein [Methylobacterium fujisawaense]|uniref:DUF3892 domain-containing protein n=1 Tax=Methylobacterium fujisawaense TaxID=107400 RepID=UPI00313DD7A5